jgi:hypothetical protein
MTVFHDILKRFIPAVGNVLSSLHFAFSRKGSPEVDRSASNFWLLFKNRDFSAPFGKGYCGCEAAGSRAERQCIEFDYASHPLHLSAYLQQLAVEYKDTIHVNFQLHSNLRHLQPFTLSHPDGNQKAPSGKPVISCFVLQPLEHDWQYLIPFFLHFFQART